jgi:hypothetical protein
MLEVDGFLRDEIWLTEFETSNSYKKWMRRANENIASLDKK